MVVRLVLDPEAVRLHHGDREVAGLELHGGHASPALALGELEHAAVEVDGLFDVLRRDGDEVRTGDQGGHCFSSQGAATVSPWRPGTTCGGSRLAFPRRAGGRRPATPP